MMNRRHFALALAFLMAAGLPGHEARAGVKVTVFAAASLKNALDAVTAAWAAETGKEATISYAASSALAKQIESGAPVDVFISADRDWMNYLTEKQLVKAGTAVDLLGNEIVLVAPKDSSAKIAIEKDFALAKLLDGGKLAMGDVKAVPAGKYGKAALDALSVWSSVESHVAQAENVRAALKLVSTGEASLGIVYRTDAKAEPGVRVIGIFPADSHPPIVYPAAPVAASQNPDAAPFVTYLQSEKAQAIFRDQGFTVLVPPATN